VRLVRHGDLRGRAAVARRTAGATARTDLALRRPGVVLLVSDRRGV